jgi:hypothetical protein
MDRDCEIGCFKILETIDKGGIDFCLDTTGLEAFVELEFGPSYSTSVV